MHKITICYIKTNSGDNHLFKKNSATGGICNENTSVAFDLAAAFRSNICASLILYITLYSHDLYFTTTL